MAREMIRSLQNGKIKKYAALHEKKMRDQLGMFLIEEEHMVQEAKTAGLLDALFILEGYEPKVSCAVEYEVSEEVMKKLSSTVSLNRVIGLCHKPTNSHPVRHAILLDRVQDPGNIGTIIRTAYAFGYDAVILSPGSCDPYNPKVLRSTQGAIFRIPLIMKDMKDAIVDLQAAGSFVYATALQHAVPFEQASKVRPVSLLMGNEGQGVSSDLLPLCDTTINIEMKQFESLNVAVAASIVAYHFR